MSFKTIHMVKKKSSNWVKRNHTSKCAEIDFSYKQDANIGRVRLGYSGIKIYSGIYPGIYSSYSAPRSRIAGMEIQVFRNANSSQTNAYSHYSNYSYSGLISNERALRFLMDTPRTWLLEMKSTNYCTSSTFISRVTLTTPAPNQEEKLTPKKSWVVT